MKGGGAAGAIAIGLIRGASPEIKGWGTEKGGACQSTMSQPWHAETGGSQGQLTGRRQGEGTGDTHERVNIPFAREVKVQ